MLSEDVKVTVKGAPFLTLSLAFGEVTVTVGLTVSLTILSEPTVAEPMFCAASKATTRIAAFVLLTAGTLNWNDCVVPERPDARLVLKSVPLEENRILCETTPTLSLDVKVTVAIAPALSVAPAAGAVMVTVGGTVSAVADLWIVKLLSLSSNAVLLEASLAVTRMRAIVVLMAAGMRKLNDCVEPDRPVATLTGKVVPPSVERLISWDTTPTLSLDVKEMVSCEPL